MVADKWELGTCKNADDRLQRCLLWRVNYPWEWFIGDNVVGYKQSNAFRLRVKYNSFEWSHVSCRSLTAIFLRSNQFNLLKLSRSTDSSLIFLSHFWFCEMTSPCPAAFKRNTSAAYNMQETISTENELAFRRNKCESLSRPGIKKKNGERNARISAKHKGLNQTAAPRRMLPEEWKQWKSSVECACGTVGDWRSEWWWWWY